MSRRKKKKHDEEHVDESWLVPYADILTLLLALFVILFAMSSVNAQKFTILSKAFNEMFTGGTGLLSYDAPVQGNNPGLVEKKTEQQKGKTQQKNKAEKENTDTEQNQEESEMLKRQEELYALLSKMNGDIAKSNLTGKLNVALTDDGLLVTIRDDILFDSGSAEVRPQNLETAREISNLLISNPPRSITISGHTDNVPIKNSKYESNWELSVMRAVNFMRVLLQNNQLNPQYFSAKGFGEYQPVASNDTPEGRTKNRRVEILISPWTDK